MDRLACVDVPELPLQLLLLRHPKWGDRPAAVVESDRPQGRILWVNEIARRSAILPGLSFAQGLSLATDLRAAVVPPLEIEAGVDGLADTLRRFCPDVEAAAGQPGVFWLGADGLSPLFPSATSWARTLARQIEDSGFRATVVVGFRRFGAYAVAKAQTGVVVFRTPAEEDAAMRRVRLDRLAVSPKLRDTLGRLAVHTVGDFLRLPASGLRRRFGAEAQELHDLATGEAFAPLRPTAPVEPVRETIQLEPPDDNAVRLLFVIKRHLHVLLGKLAERVRGLAELELRFALERHEPRVDRIRPAEPSLDEALIVDLVRLRLEAAPLCAAVGEIVLIAHDAPADRKQLRLFFETPKRDLAAGDRALARLRALLGPDAILKAKLKDAHLPEACFEWAPLDRLRFPEPGPQPAHTPLIRRIYADPTPLPPRPHAEPEVRLVRDLPCGLITGVWGPYIVSGGWWRADVHRRYYFAKTQRGDVLWIYYDGPRRRWFLHGRVE